MITTNIDNNNFPGSVTEGVTPRSCLVVNWEKAVSNSTEEATKDKWTGTFKWLWSFVNGDKGFVMFSVAKPSDTEKQFDLEGGIYFLSNEKDSSGANKSWKIKKYKEVNGSAKTIKDGDFEQNFPQVGDNLDGIDSTKQPNWGFMSGKQDLDKLCKKGESDCPKTPTEKKPDFKVAWKWQVGTGEGVTTPDKWSKSFSTNLSNLFGTEVSSLSFSNFKGNWKQITSTSETASKQ